jgi:hypothetical protein
VIVVPVGDVLCDGRTEPAATLVTIDLGAVDTARSKVPSLTHGRAYSAPPEIDVLIEFARSNVNQTMEASDPR